MNHIYDEFLQIPPVTRAYTSLCALTTLAVHLDIVTPLNLYFNPTLIFKHYQFWRLFTNFCYFGPIGFSFFFNMIFIYRYCRMLEENHFRGKEADFILMLLFGGTLTMAMGAFFAIIFLGHAFTIMIIYVWSRRNPFIRMNFFGLFNFHAPYLPWVLFGFSFLLNSSIVVDIIGIVVGHIYYFLEDVYPRQTNGFKILKTPQFLKTLFEAPANDPNYDDLDPGDDQGNEPGGFAWGDARNG